MMSAWGIGATAATEPTEIATATAGGAEAGGTQPGVSSVDTLVKWIPGEVLAAYAAIVLALQPEQSDGMASQPLEITSGWWLVAGGVFAAALTWLAGWSKTDDLDRVKGVDLGVRTMLAAAAFAIWSFVIPGSAWYSIDTIGDNPELIPILAGIVGVAFALVAEAVVRRVPHWVTSRGKG
jgi:hypothetical protein